MALQLNDDEQWGMEAAEAGEQRVHWRRLDRALPRLRSGESGEEVEANYG